MIATYISLEYTTLELLSSTLTERSWKVGPLLETIAHASEYASNPDLRLHSSGERRSLELFFRHSPLFALSSSEMDVSAKVLAIFQMQMLARDEEEDSTSHRSASFRCSWKERVMVLREALRLLQAAVDVIASSGWLKPALAVMDVCQCLVQGVKPKADSLLQVPGLNVARIEELRLAAVEGEMDSPLDVLAMDEGVRTDLFSRWKLSPPQVSAVASFGTASPDVSMSVSDVDSTTLEKGGPLVVRVTLEREAGGEDGETIDVRVRSDVLPFSKKENWWLVVGEMASNTLHAIKRVSLHKASTEVTLQLAAPDQAGEYLYQVYLVCDTVSDAIWITKCPFLYNNTVCIFNP
jgi:pre-mRNA-splicing helicase BRR2